IPVVETCPPRRREPEDLSLAVELSPGHPALCAGGAEARFDPEPFHRGEVDDDAVITHGEARGRMPAAPHGHLEPALARVAAAGAVVPALGSQAGRTRGRLVPEIGSRLGGGSASPCRPGPLHAREGDVHHVLPPFLTGVPTPCRHPGSRDRGAGCAALLAR